MGFMAVDRLAQAHQISLDKRKFDVVFGRGKVGPHPVILAKPMAYMNRSGPAVRDLAYYYRLDAQNIVVIHDDIDLVFGKIKIKQKGGDGGHNGVGSLIQALGGGEFVRLRLGIGRPQAQQQAKAYVLGRFNAEEEELLDEFVSNTKGVLETILAKGVAEAMNRFHGDTIFKK